MPALAAWTRSRWRRVHEGIFVDHTGVPTWRQGAWAAVLYHWSAALAGRSALRADGVTIGREDDDIELVVTGSRRVDDPVGTRSTRLTAYDEVVLHHLSPPRVRSEHAVLGVASRAATQDAAVAVVADSCQQRRCTPARLRRCGTGCRLPTLPRAQDRGGTPAPGAGAPPLSAA